MYLGTVSGRWYACGIPSHLVKKLIQNVKVKCPSEVGVFEHCTN